jgi:hypothetical protein
MVEKTAARFENGKIRCSLWSTKGIAKAELVYESIFAITVHMQFM